MNKDLKNNEKFFNKAEHVEYKIWKSGHVAHELLIGTVDQHDVKFLDCTYNGKFFVIPIKEHDEIRSAIMTKEGDKVYLRN